MNQYQPSIADQGFQAEIPISQYQSPPKESSGVATFFKTIVKIILWIGAIILLLPVAAVIFCIVFFILGSIMNIIRVGTILFTGFTIINNKRISKKYLPLLIFATIFSLLFLAGQYDVQSFNCPLHYNYNLFMPIIQLFAFIVGFVGFCYSGFVSFNKLKC